MYFNEDERTCKDVKVELSGDDKMCFVMDIMEPMLSNEDALGVSLVEMLLEILHFSRSDIDVLKSSLKRIYCCKRIAEMNMARVVDGVIKEIFMGCPRNIPV